jgi:hypothetical protein|tara:strand:- start:7981 stop:8793 length:813 start_codon:yes stop_codon:yes gene_type:complete
MREPKLGMAVGRKGIGKTYQTKILIESYVYGNPEKGVEPRKVLILDVNDEFTDYKAISMKDLIKFSVMPKAEIRRVRPFNEKTGVRLTLKEIADLLWDILHYFRGGMLLIEDINKYISDFLPNDLVGAICSNRHTDLDIIMHFQSIGRITTKVWQNANWLRFHKNSDSIERHKNKFPDKYEIFSIAENIVNTQYFNDNKYYYLYVDLDDEKIKGKMTPAIISDGIDDYLSKNFNSIVKPEINKKNLTDGTKIDRSEAIERVRSRIKQQYF